MKFYSSLKKKKKPWYSKKLALLTDLLLIRAIYKFLILINTISFSDKISRTQYLGKHINLN